MGGLGIREGEGGFVEDDVPGDDDSVCGEVKAAITLVMRGVAEERTQGGARSKFVGGGGGEIRIAGTAKRAQIVIGGKSAMEGKVRSAHAKGFGGEAIDDEGGSGKSINPVGRGHGGLEKKSANDIVDGAKHAFGFAILLRGVRAGHPKGDTFGKKESARGSIIKLATIVTLHNFYSAVKLSENKSEKIGERGEGFRF
jgi:hypothetical protein